MPYIGKQPTPVPLSTSDLDDNVVTLAKMDGLARGKLIYGDANGDPAALAVGAANEVLTHDGTDFDWAAAAGAVSALNNASNNELVTVGSVTTELDAEADLTYDGTDFDVEGTTDGSQRRVRFTNLGTSTGSDIRLILSSREDTWAGDCILEMEKGSTATKWLFGSVSGSTSLSWDYGTGTLGAAQKMALSSSGALSKVSGSFKIKHPLESKNDTHHLVHSFIEGPRADLIYRGRVTLVDGIANVNIDTDVGMTEGTFVALCDDVQCFTTNESDWDAIKGSVTGNILTIESQNPECNAEISWMVIGDRKDDHMLEDATNWTDENGKVILEPLQPEPVPEEPEE